MAESVITATIIISFLLVLGHQTLTKTYTEDMSLRGYRILEDASQKESFRQAVYDVNISRLHDSVEVPGYYYNFSVCDYSESCSGFSPDSVSSTIWASSYIYSGQEEYEPRVLRLYIWR